MASMVSGWWVNGGGALVCGQMDEGGGGRDVGLELETVIN